MAQSDWLKKRSRGVHLTIRDVDCIDFDTERLAKDLHELGVNVLSFFCAGYVTVHPTSLSIRTSPFLGDRDLTGDIVKAVHQYDIRAVAAMDLSLIPGNAALAHPDWCSCDQDGKPYKANQDLGDFYIACPLSGYQNEYLAEILTEIVTRYDVDGIKFGGGSYGFSSYGNGICHCARCKAAFSAFSGQEIPVKDDWNDPVWGTFQRWRQQRVVERSQFLYELVKSLDPNMPVMCNSVCFGETGWTHERRARYRTDGRIYRCGSGRGSNPDPCGRGLRTLGFSTVACRGSELPEQRQRPPALGTGFLFSGVAMAPQCGTARRAESVYGANLCQWGQCDSESIRRTDSGPPGSARLPGRTVAVPLCRR
ncbi:family 10 glycosylhydrolase [Paenibacillus sp. TAB 01]|uniref:family 10 glycosylhydrolase n=1 Tax=Paenibacillus sp. TAB 01 TaxID=3368988 RepID=UPI003751FA6F